MGTSGRMSAMSVMRSARRAATNVLKCSSVSSHAHAPRTAPPSLPPRRCYSTGTSPVRVLGDEKISLQLLETIADNSFDSILITDMKHEIIYANSAFTKLTGWNVDEVIGKAPKLLQGTGTDPKVIGHLNNALKTGQDFEGKAINFRKDGTPFIMHWRVAPVKIGDDTKVWVAIQREGTIG